MYLDDICHKLKGFILDDRYLIELNRNNTCI